MIFFPHKFAHYFSQMFPALRLFFFPNFPGPTYIQGPMLIPCPTSITDSRVVKLKEKGIASQESTKNKKAYKQGSYQY